MRDGLSERLVWRKSTRSAGDGECVEVARSQSYVFIRDSKNREGPALTVNATMWKQFILSVKSHSHRR
jgi:hypothetical protein